MPGGLVTFVTAAVFLFPCFAVLALWNSTASIRGSVEMEEEMIDLADFENWAITTKEKKTAVFIDEMRLADLAVTHDQIHHHEDPPPRLARWLAHLWGQSTTHSVNVLARMAEVFSDDDVRPDVPLSLYKAVMETDDPSAWLERALAEGLSARGVRDTYGSIKGKHFSSCKFEGEVEVLEWEPATGRFAVTGLPISGEMPRVARVTVQEALQEKESDDTNS